MAINNGSAAPFLDVTIHLLGHFLSLELNISAVEMLRIDPCHWSLVDVDVIEKEYVGRANRPAQFLLLLFHHLWLSTQTNTLRFEPISENIFEVICLFLRFTLVDIGDAVCCSAASNSFRSR